MSPDRRDDLQWLNDPIVQAVIERICRTVTETVIAEHVRSCPHGQKLAIRWAYLIGACTACGVLGGAGGFAVARAIAGL